MKRVQATRICLETFKALTSRSKHTGNCFLVLLLKEIQNDRNSKTHTQPKLNKPHRLVCKQRKQNHVCTTRLAALQDPQEACSTHPALEANPLQISTDSALYASKRKQKGWQTCGIMQHGQSGKTGSSEVVTLKKFRSCAQSNLVGKRESETKNAIKKIL